MNMDNNTDAFIDYFAYGSNTSLVQMSKRCPNSILISTAFLSDHQLHFPRRSKNRSCGVASIQKSIGGIVWGVIFRIPLSDIAQLDIDEGVPKGAYRKENIVVQNIMSSASHNAFTYIAIPQNGVFEPSKEYLKIILDGLQGRDDIPNEYIRSISRIKTQD